MNKSSNRHAKIMAYGQETPKKKERLDKATDEIMKILTNSDLTFEEARDVLDDANHNVDNAVYKSIINRKI